MAVIFALALFLSTLHLGRILDVSQPPEKVDIIVSLGGDHRHERLNRALKLWERGYSKSAFLMINGFNHIKFGNSPQKIIFNTNEKKYLERHGFPMKNVIYMFNAPNTMAEIRFVKTYLLTHGMHSVMIVSSPPHMRRIRMLARLAGFKKAGIHLNLVSSLPEWWHKEEWWHSRYARRAVLSEVVKIPVNYFKYAVFEPLGLLNTCGEKCHHNIYRLKNYVRSIIKKTLTF